jgi:hypothetical protein
MAHTAHDQDRDRLRDLRTELYGCLTKWGDALFELCDAALCAPGALHSVPSLSLEPTFRRSHGSLYKALARGQIDEERLRRLLVANRPSHWPEVFAVDASVWDRCDAECSPERGFLLLSVETFGGPAHRGRVELPVDLPALVHARQLDGALSMPYASRPRWTPPTPPLVRSVVWWRLSDL